MDYVLRLILFHQSMKAMEMQVNKVNLTDEEMQRYCDKPFYKMVQSLVIAENQSYILFDQSHIDRCNREILNNFANMMTQEANPSQQKSSSADTADQSSSNPESPKLEKR